MDHHPEGKSWAFSKGLSILKLIKLFGAGFTVSEDGLGRRTYFCLTCRTRPTTDYRQHLQSVSHRRRVEESQVLLQSLTQARQIQQSQPPQPHLDPMLLDSLAFVTPSMEQPIGSDEESDQENLLAVARATGLTLFDPRNAEESDSEPEIDWDELLFETQPEGAALSEREEPLERNINSPWFPFKSKEVCIPAYLTDLIFG